MSIMRAANSAIRIVPPTVQEDHTKQSPAKKDSIQRQCRNLVIYGSCKFQDKGCIYWHGPDELNDTPAPGSPSMITLPAKAVNAAPFVPKMSKDILPKGSSSPEFIPRIPAGIASRAASIPSFVPRTSAMASVPEFTPQSTTQPFNTPASLNPYDQHQSQIPYNPDTYPSTDFTENPYEIANPAEYDPSYYMEMDAFQAYSAPAFTRQPLAYHLYTPPTPSGQSSSFVPALPNLRETLLRRAEAMYVTPNPELGLPEEVSGYHSLISLEPLEGAPENRKKFGSWYSTVYRATKASDGTVLCLRRIEGFRLTQTAAFTPIEAWHRIPQPNIIRVREAFTTRAFGDNSLVVCYDYHPGAKTLHETYFKPKAPEFVHGRYQAPSAHIPEDTLWTYIIQIASAIKAAHDNGLAVRMIDLTKILVTGKNRLRISSCGLFDIMTYDSHHPVVPMQQEDLLMFAGLLIALCTVNAAVPPTNERQAMETISRLYSPDLKSVILFLMTKAPPNVKSIGHLFDMIGSRLLVELDESNKGIDMMEGYMMGELENARLFRLMTKMGFINERPEFSHEPRWSETGDRYIIKLFRDYVFHQVDEHGRPVVNMSHVVACLNKLDVGVEERIMLVSRDEQSCLVVSYKEVRACIEAAYNDLSRPTT